MSKLLLPLVIVTAAAATTALGDDGAAPRTITVTRVSADTVSAASWTAIEDGALVLRTDDSTVRVPLGDVIEIATGTPPDPPRTHQPDEVRLDLWSGEEISGRIGAGDDRGITILNPVLGEVRVDIDAVAGLRFPLRLSQVADTPDLRPSEDSDVVHLTGGDRIACTIEELGTGGLICSTDANDALDVSYDRVTAVRLMPTGEAPSAGGALTVVLRDGSRVRGAEPRVVEGRLTLTSVSGFEATAALADVVSVLVESDGFRYLSDLAEPTIQVDPFWEPVAGKAEDIYQPRMDRAFSGALLRAGGRTWLKGIGVFSGTTLSWDIAGAWRELRTQVAVDDAAGRLGAVVFVIEVDGEERWRSDLVVGAADAASRSGATRGPIDAGRIPLDGAQRLTLRVLAGNDENPYPIQDEADWLGAMLIR